MSFRSGDFYINEEDRIRTRLYITSESHVHSVVNAIKVGPLLKVNVLIQTFQLFIILIYDQYLPLIFFKTRYLTNAWVYNLISVTQVTRVSLEDAIVSSKTEPRNGNKKENRSYGEVRNNKAMLKILSLFRILYLKQQSDILRSFSV